MAAWDVVQGTDLGLQEVVQYTVCNVVSMFSLAGVPGATELLLSLLYANSSSTARPQVTFVRVVADNKLLVFHSGQVLTSGGQSRLSTLTRMKEFIKKAKGRYFIPLVSPNMWQFLLSEFCRSYQP